MNRELVTRLRKLSQQYAYTSIRMHERIAREAGFSGTDHKYLGFFLQKSEMTAGELAGLTGLTTGAVTGLIDRFEKKQLVRRQFSETDRRKVIIVADTEKITALLAPFYREFRSSTEALIASFSSREMEVLQRYFLEAIEIMQETMQKSGAP